MAMPAEFTATSLRVLALRVIFLDFVDADLLRSGLLPESLDDLAHLAASPGAADAVDTAFAVMIALGRRHFDLASVQGERLLTLISLARTSESTALIELYPSVQAFVGERRVNMGQLQGALECFREAYKRADDNPLAYFKPAVTANLAFATALTSDVEAATWLERYDSSASPDSWLATFAGTQAQTSRMLQALDRLDLAAAGKAAATIAGQVHRNDWWAYHAYVRAMHALHLGAAADALQCVDAARADHPDWHMPPAAGALLTAAEADALMALGRGNLAASLLAQQPDHSYLRVARARFALLIGDSVAAIRLAMDSAWERGALARHRHEMLLIKAVAAHRVGDASAQEALRLAVGCMRTSGALRPFTTVPREELREIGKDVVGFAQMLDEPALVGAVEVFPHTIDLISLTRRELALLESIAAGLSIQQAANAVGISYSTVRTQQRSLYRKLGVENQADAVAMGRLIGVIR